ncbi:hypothetical protein EDB83DRAFT_2426161 [Lactarius deliciosus]|nr:hypothetical protein EDB83DRAFT_2426161 [Lactarius deliciosus]
MSQPPLVSHNLIPLVPCHPLGRVPYPGSYFSSQLPLAVGTGVTGMTQLALKFDHETSRVLTCSRSSFSPGRCRTAPTFSVPDHGPRVLSTSLLFCSGSRSTRAQFLRISPQHGLTPLRTNYMWWCLQRVSYLPASAKKVVRNPLTDIWYFYNTSVKIGVSNFHLSTLVSHAFATRIFIVHMDSGDLDVPQIAILGEQDDSPARTPISRLSLTTVQAHLFISTTFSLSQHQS